jgi:hypothetical protein
MFQCLVRGLNVRDMLYDGLRRLKRWSLLKRMAVTHGGIGGKPVFADA